ncbi:hypothetical protein DPMN_183745 [Dreissena polymorpha]|uniref:Uncharacterized protein n=1 Tax=Dreissena polymorpha TaxID=45954 RepID=A0A9D4DGJ9_DREPO|nr:hypothetical protein DPMN_183745 [Dreissena polymorpha]
MTMFFQLKLLTGNIPTPSAVVDVPHLLPGEEGAICVDFVSPSQSGRYRGVVRERDRGKGPYVWTLSAPLSKVGIEER